MRRREILGAPLAAAGRGAMDGAASRITVTDLEAFTVRVNRRGNWVLARLHTSAGLTGLGDASHSYADSTCIEIMRRLAGRLRGRGIFSVEWLREIAGPEVARHGRVGAVALSGVEQCLWDLQGQALGVPCYQLFGGALRTRIRNYANINRSTEDRNPAGFAQMARRAARAGFDAVKLAPFDDLPRKGGAGEIEEFTRLGIDRARAVREAIGPKADLLIDAHSRFDVARGLDVARRLEPLNLFWLEEVTPPNPLDNLAAINRAARMPTAGGESIYGVQGFLPYVNAGAVDITMPDVKYCGGMLELKKIAALSEAAGLQVSPHGPASPVGNLAASHVCAGLPNFLILEYAFGEIPWRAELVDPPEELTGGFLSLSERPGLGVRLNEKTALRYRA